MLVNKYTIRIPHETNTTGTTLTIPLSMNSQLVDQSDDVKKNFVDVEVEKSINPILDYEKVRCIPITDGIEPETITYNLNFLDSNGGYGNTTYGEIGFNDSDIKFRKNSFKKSFLRLSFYDSDIVITQRLVSYLTLYPKLDSSNFSKGTTNSPWGTVTPANNLSIKFTVGDSIKDSTKDGEGYFLYHYKDEISSSLPKELFMRASFNNAKTGKSTNLMTTDKKVVIDELFKTTNGVINLKNNVHTKYILTRDNTGYYYMIDNNYSNNVSFEGTSYVVNLYEINVI
jgi:hypothetical protein